MVIRLMVFLFGAVLLTGCSLTKSSSAVDNLQIKVAQLERRVEEKDQEIEDLRGEISRLENEGTEAHDEEFDRRPVVEYEPLRETSGSGTSAASANQSEIIRVDADVKMVQKALKNAGYYKGAVDGKLGSGSKQAIVDFQKDHDLTADGIIGRKTWSELKTYLE